MSMEQVTPLLVTNHYHRNRSQYDDIQSTLRETRECFLSAPRHKQIQMLQKSHSFAVISVQTPVHIHEEAFRQLWEGVDSRGRPPEWNLDTALKSVNYKNNKSDYIRHSFDHAHLWDDVSNMLEEGEIDNAHKFILDNMKGVGPAKAPFVLSMLGFEEKMCIDANIVSTMGLDEHVSTVVVEKYDKICQTLRDKMPTLRDETTPFMWQWIVFDWKRGEISHHNVFYQII